MSVPLPRRVRGRLRVHPAGLSRFASVAHAAYKLTHWPRAGQKVLSQGGAVPGETAAHQLLCAYLDVFSLHAAIRVVMTRADFGG